MARRSSGDSWELDDDPCLLILSGWLNVEVKKEVWLFENGGRKTIEVFLGEGRGMTRTVCMRVDTRIVDDV